MRQSEAHSFVDAMIVALMAGTALLGCAGEPPRVGKSVSPEKDVEHPAACDQGEHVHIFLVHGLDPLDWADLRALRDHLCQLGYRHVRLGQSHDTGKFHDEIRGLRHEDPRARIAVIGFSMGARKAHALAATLRDEGEPLDLLVYLDGKGLAYVSEDHVCLARRVVNVMAPGLLLRAPTLTGAENLYLSDVWHYGVPTHPATFAVLARELKALTADMCLTPGAVHAGP
jgi:hypothetical protein